MVGRLHLALTAGDAQVGGRLHALVSRLNGKGATVDGHEAAGRVLVVARLDAVFPGRHRERAVGDLHAILAVQTVLLGGHGDRTARHDKIVLRVHAVAVVALDGQRARAIDGQVSLGIQRGVGLVLPFRQHVACTVGQRVLRTCGQGHEHLVGLLDVQRRSRLVANGGAAKHDLHLVRIARVHRERPGRQLAAHHVGARRGNNHRGAFHRSPFAGHRRALARQRNLRCRGLIVGGVPVAVGVREIHTGDVDERRPVHRIGRTRGAVVALGLATLSLLGLLAGTFGGLFEGAPGAPRQRQRSRQRHGQGPATPSPSSRHASAHYLVRLQLQHVSPFVVCPYGLTLLLGLSP